MNSTERVMAAISFRRPDRVPYLFRYWAQFLDRWERERGQPMDTPGGGYGKSDVYYASPNEAPWPSRAATISRSGDGVVARNAWGAVIRSRPGAFFYEELELPLVDRGDLDRLEFESPAEDRRYESVLRAIDGQRSRPDPPCIFGKIGGPYLRTSNLRGTEQWLVDIAEDPEFASALAGKVTEHLTAVGLEFLRRANLHDTGLWIFDDFGCNQGLMVSPKSYERIFLPLMRRMIGAFKAAGARKVLLHSDGNILPALDGLVEASLDLIDPVEPKAGMDVVALRRKYGDRLAYSGGLDNAHILPEGTDAEVREHVLRVLEAGRDGGLIVGCHSIGPDISPDRHDYVLALIREYGASPASESQPLGGQASGATILETPSQGKGRAPIGS